MITFINTQTDPPAAIDLDPRQPPSILVTAGSFESNMFRALLVIFFKLSILGALGITAGLLFSMPVAAFAAFAIVIFFMSAGFISKVAADTDVQLYRPIRHLSAMDEYLVWQFRVFNAAVRPVHRLETLEALPRGELITWPFVGRAFVTAIVIYSGLLCLAGAFMLSRRELGLPSE